MLTQVTLEIFASTYSGILWLCGVESEAILMPLEKFELDAPNDTCWGNINLTWNFIKLVIIEPRNCAEFRKFGKR